MKIHIPLALLLVVLLAACNGPSDPVDFVNPLVGTGGHGHTYPGATTPFGMVQVSPDTRLEGWDGCSGYHYTDSILYGFSHTHLSGTGIPDYCDILLMPTVGDVHIINGYPDKKQEGYASYFSHKTEKASPGYYAVHLDDYDIQAELTASPRVAMHRYTFPAKGQRNIILDLQHRDYVIESSLKLVSPTEVEGYRRSSSWARDQLVYFVMKFSEPFVSKEIFSHDSLVNADSLSGKSVKAAFMFPENENKTVIVKVALSGTSTEGARKNLQAEMPGWDFYAYHNQARKIWNETLGKIQVNGNKETKKIFYTALYHSYLAPDIFSDVDGSYLGMDRKVHQGKGKHFTVFSLWDTFRALHPLMTILEPGNTEEMVNTMVEDYTDGGLLPVWELASNETYCMIGYHSVPVIYDAYSKGLRNFDAEKAFEGMKHSAMQDHFGLDAYKKYGYIPSDADGENVSKTLEYAFDDWCIALMAKSLGKEDDYRYFLKRSKAYQFLYDDSTRCMRPRLNGAWFTPFDPREVDFNFTEANSWQYSFFVPHDINNHIRMMGGDSVYIHQLDALFNAPDETLGRQQSDITGLIGQYAHGNEPSHHVAYLYNYAGAPWKTQEKVHQIMTSLYQDNPEGLCGNDDCGQMSAWYVLSALGFYEVTPGSGIYVIGTPAFRDATLKLDNGKNFRITAVNYSPNNFYIQHAELNGKKLEHSFLTHAEILAGGKLVLTLGRKPNKDWCASPKERPVAEVTGVEVVTPPWLQKFQKTFSGTTEIALCAADKDSVFYTLDGSDPTIKSNLYRLPFILDKSTTIKAIAVKNGNLSTITTSEIHRIPEEVNITVVNPFNPQYSAGGKWALIDGFRGGDNFKTGVWQGYHGCDMITILDFSKPRSFQEFGAGFLQDQGSWILFPPKVEFQISEDGINFRSIGTVLNKFPVNTNRPLTQDYVLRTSVKTRYLKVIAAYAGPLPEWHPGAGGESHLFSDEIFWK